MEDVPPISVLLEVTTKEHHVTATLTFRNQSKSNQYIDKRMGCIGNKITHNIFQIASNGHSVRYKFPLKKLPEATPEDMLVVQPGMVVRTHLQLEEAYEFLAGFHAYKAFYSAFHSNPDSDDIIELKSNVVSFSVSG